MDESKTSDEPTLGDESSGRRNDSIGWREDDTPTTTSESFRTSFDTRDDSAGATVVSAVAAVSGADPRRMEPLHNVIDMDALDSLFKPGSDGYVRFSYHGNEVLVRSNGIITVTPETG